MSEQLTEHISAEDARVEPACIADIETKAASGSSEDVALAFDEFMRAFEAFKATNEERIGQIEKRLSADVLTSEKLDRINSAIDEHKAIVDELALKSARPQLGASTFRSGSTLQHKAAFEAYVRHGEAHGLHSLEEKALSVGSGPDGGYLVPAETEAAAGGGSIWVLLPDSASSPRWETDDRRYFSEAFASVASAAICVRAAATAASDRSRAVAI